MKFCVNYYKNFRYFDEVDEIIIPYSIYKDNIVEFVTKRFPLTKRIIIDIAESALREDAIPILCKLQKEHENIAVRLQTFYPYEINYYKEAGIPCFFNYYCYSVDQIYGYILMGVSDIYIVEELAFRIKEIAPYCRAKNINIRVIPNVAQHGKGVCDEIPGICKFFIRPEDIDMYEEYVDVCELLIDKDKLSALFDIYKSGQWKGDLQQVIIGLNTEVANTGLTPYFGKHRLDCQHKCMIEKCTLCMDAVAMAEKFYENGIEILKKRKEFRGGNEYQTNEEVSEFLKTAVTDNDVEISEN